MIGSLLGATAMAVGSLPLNYYIIYPIYEKLHAVRDHSCSVPRYPSGGKKSVAVPADF